MNFPGVLPSGKFHSLLQNASVPSGRMAEVYRKGTQGSLLAWRAASLLLIRLLFCIKPHMRDDGKAAEGA